ncbi:MAG: DNA polymerase IV [Candidatus Omnitrophica bacterium]|nr:DNA polymerase IV [Candidatus Omnitrophota bacterium]
MSKVILHVDLDAFFAAVEQRDDPQLRGKPVVVGADPQGGKGRGVVSTCSYEARKFGIRSAMPISKAYQLCPSAIFVEPHFQKYSEASRAVFKIFHDFTPHIQGLSIDEAFMDITTSAHLFGGPLETAKRLKERVRQEVGLTASVGIASVKFVAKIASDLSKPDGLITVPADGVVEFLKPLKIERLWGVGPKTAEVLHLSGIETIGQLAEIPLNDMRERFGESGEHLYDLSHGIDLREVEEDTGIKSVSHEHTFNVDTSNPEEILAMVLDLSEHVSRRLRRKDNLKGKTITVKIRLQGFETYTRAVTLGERTNFTDVIFSNAKSIFEKFFKPGMKVRLIGVRVNNFEDAYVQDSLFSDPVDVRREKIHTVVDMIKNKFGEDAISRAKK